MIKKKVLIASGGTGGHVFPACGLANYLISQNFNVKLTIDKRGKNYLKGSKNIELITLQSSPLIKKNFIKFSFSIIINIFSILKSLSLLINNRPSVIFGMGGYSSFPICVAAKILKIPFIIYENNLYIGKANSYLLPFANKIFVSHKELEGISEKHKKKIIEIGNIIRKEIFNLQSRKYSNHIDNELKILVLGGSQAAKIFAEKLPEIFKKCKENKIVLKIYQQCLPEQNEFLISFYKNLNIHFETFNFSNNILEYFVKTDLAITRSGSSMLAELINAKIPFISVPLPTSAEDHQLKNATYYEKNGYSYLIEEKDLSKDLFKLIKKIHEEKSLLKQMINKQKQYSDKLVYEIIDKQICNIINEKH